MQHHVIAILNPLDKHDLPASGNYLMGNFPVYNSVQEASQPEVESEIAIAERSELCLSIVESRFIQVFTNLRYLFQHIHLPERQRCQ